MTTDIGERIHVERAGVVAMALSAEEAFPLFNAEGERRRVAGWNPRYVHPVKPGAGEGVIFQTVKKDLGTATWVQQTRHEPGAGKPDKGAFSQRSALNARTFTRECDERRRKKHGVSFRTVPESTPCTRRMRRKS